jgi:hypothetical protein
MSPEQLAKQAGLIKRHDCEEWICNTNHIESFFNLVTELERERIATSIERLPFGDTAASFAIYVRELKDE